MPIEIYQTMPPKRGKTAARHRMRCRDCRTRYTLKRHPDLYRQSWRTNCPACKSANVRSVEAERRREMKRQDTCHCTHYPFPHRAGSLTFCDRNGAWATGYVPTTDDLERYQRVIETPRTASG